MAKCTVCIGVFERERGMIRAIPRVAALANASRASAIGRASSPDQKPMGFYDNGHGLKRLGSGHSLHGSWPESGKAALVWVDGLGPLRLVGPVVSWMLRAVHDGVVFEGVCIFGLALHTIGIPEEATRKYDLKLLKGRYVLIAETTDEQAEEVLAQMRRSGATDSERFANIDTRSEGAEPA